MMRMMWMVLAALAGARAVVAAAGTIRAVLVVVTFLVRPFAPALMAVRALRAVPVVAALGAGCAMRLVLTADQAVAAIDLWAAEPARGDLEHTAVLADALAAIADRDALVVTAFFANEAEALDADAFFHRAGVAIRAVGVVTALRIGAHVGIVANRAAFAVIVVAALIGRVVAALRAFAVELALRAIADAEAIDAVVGAAIAVAITASTVRLLGQTRMEAAWRAGDGVGVGIAMLRLALAIDTGFAGFAVADARAAITAFAWVAVVIARAAIVQSDTHVAFAFLAGPTIAIVHARNAISIGGITWVVANRCASRAVAIIATWRARTTLGRAAKLARWA